ncbi:hypothetical protein O3M35_009542 [Rhynocoris fuscipes]|uniref:Uncharacterized protein n=1 Tax=Rhynocoris fuscipes TaxID=488301 RepID=A0AAW1D428_9HEMI
MERMENVKLYESPLMKKLKYIKVQDSLDAEEEEEAGKDDDDKDDDEGEPPSDVERDAQFVTSKNENIQFELHNLIKPNKVVDDETEEKYAEKFDNEQEVQDAIDKALGNPEVVDYTADVDNDGEFGELDDLDEYNKPDEQKVDLKVKNLKVIMNLYDITEFVIVEENFVENINKVIAEKDATGMASASLASSILTANYNATQPSKTNLTAVSADIKELKKKSYCRVTAATRPAKIIRKIKRNPLYIRLYYEQPNQPKPLKLIGVSELKLDQSFINTIVLANTSSVVPQSHSIEETLRVINGLEEHIADVKILFRLACFGRIPWPECPDTLLRKKTSECTVIKCSQSDHSDVYLNIEDQ